ncbi:MAG: calcium-binding protein, partial [Leptolyngbyaceae cyanobacterium SL_7_1]|nr:calcium-binding protein [Leptolyngbyaceae cyanobacterium SL_7_1]
VNFTLTNTSLTGVGTDTLSGIERATLTGGSGNNSINAEDFSGTVTLFGRGGNDTLAGGRAADRLYGEAGRDTLSGRDGNDFLSGGADNDSLSGGDGNDSMHGDDGDDYLNGGAGNDVLTGGRGWDQINGGSGSDRLLETGNVRYFTLTDTTLTTLLIDPNPAPSTIVIPYVDTLTSIEAATLIGGDDSNTISAAGFTAGSVILQGLGGNDTLRGGNQADTLNGGTGNDILYGNAGDDWLTGGEGSDRFAFNAPSEGIDQILDFNVTTDLIQLAASGFVGLAAGGLAAAQFTLGAAASTSAHRIGYNSATGALWFDQDGTGGRAATPLAMLTPNLNLTSDRFVVV